jgi:hypothetical protein
LPQCGGRLDRASARAERPGLKPVPASCRAPTRINCGRDQISGDGDRNIDFARCAKYESILGLVDFQLIFYWLLNIAFLACGVRGEALC